ncbi:DUF664 domain-containing protein [Paeniglutamicibacter sp. ORCA_105]|uniref:mycothiol transferase n=1 Tax=Paeniglutamicibacter sp. ORCA_105 TaxID=3377336 RepID=UPI00389488E0
MTGNDQNDETEPSAIALLRDGFGRVREGIERLLDEAEPRMLRFRASSHSNSMAWLLWHLTRIQDDHFTHLARALDEGSAPEQCWISRGWVSRFNLPYAQLDTGFGHSSDQVADFGMYDGEYLLGYHRDVHEQTIGILATLREPDLSAVIDRRWNPPVTAGVRLISVLNETASHLGQAEFLKGIYADQTG